MRTQERETAAVQRKGSSRYSARPPCPDHSERRGPVESGFSRKCRNTHFSQRANPSVPTPSSPASPSKMTSRQKWSANDRASSSRTWASAKGRRFRCQSDSKGKRWSRHALRKEVSRTRWILNERMIAAGRGVVGYSSTCPGPPSARTLPRTTTLVQNNQG